MGLTSAEVEAFDVGATGEFLDALEHDLAVEEDFVADDGVVGEDEEFATGVEGGGVGVAGVGGADDLGPVFADGVLGGILADLVFEEELFDEVARGAGGAADEAAGFVEGQAPQVADKFLGEFAEFVRG